MPEHAGQCSTYPQQRDTHTHNHNHTHTRQVERAVAPGHSVRLKLGQCWPCFTEFDRVCQCLTEEKAPPSLLENIQIPVLWLSLSLSCFAINTHRYVRESRLPGKVTSKHNTGSKTGEAESRNCCIRTTLEGGQRTHLSHYIQGNNMHVSIVPFYRVPTGCSHNEYVLRSIAYAEGESI